MYKIIGADHKEYGPVSAEQLRQWLSEGRVNAATRVQAEGSGVWKSISELPEFAGVFPPAPPPAMSLPAPVRPVKNQMALWSMISGLFSLLCCSILGPLPMILGFVAMSQIKTNPGQAGAGFAITGIVTGAIATLVCILAIVVFVHSPDLFQNLQNSLNR